MTYGDVRPSANHALFFCRNSASVRPGHDMMMEMEGYEKRCN
jgi:hypothetical protein